MKRLLCLIFVVSIALSACSKKTEPSPDMLLIPDNEPEPMLYAEPERDQNAQMDVETNQDEIIEDEVVIEEIKYKSRVNTLNCRTKPDLADDKTIAAQIGYEEEVVFLMETGDFYLVRLSDGRELFCYKEFLVPAETVLYAYLPEETAQKYTISTGELEYDSEGKPIMVKNQLIDLRLVLPDAQYELLFATERNVIGEPLYPRAIPLMQKETAQNLLRAYDIFKADGYTLKIYDAYRPISVQRKLFAVVKNSKWIANPNTTASNHNRGAAVDISLISDATGEELIFPTPMHTFALLSARSSKEWTDEQRANVDYMTKIMEDCGFKRIESEWWHFNDKNSSRYMTTDIDLASLNMEPKREEN